LALGGGSTMMASPLNIKSEEVMSPDWSACTYRFPGLASCAAGGVDPLKAMGVAGRGGEESKVVGGYTSSLLPNLRSHPHDSSELPHVSTTTTTTSTNNNNNNSSSSSSSSSTTGLPIHAPPPSTPDDRDTPHDNKVTTPLFNTPRPAPPRAPPPPTAGLEGRWGFVDAKGRAGRDGAGGGRK
ncbi:hypothetical protein O3P69_001983, partial [Scylla paramamosain]